MRLTRNKLLHVLDAIESAEAELDELVSTKEWYVTGVTDLLHSAKQIIVEALQQKE